MWALITGWCASFVNVLSLLLPFSKDTGGWHIKPGVLWALCVVAFIIYVAVLYFLSPSLRETYRAPEWVHQIWLPVTGVVILAFICLGRWLWMDYQAGPDATLFPDIDAAWDQATRALAHKGIRPGDLPIFFVLGRPQEAEEHLFAAAKLPLEVPKTPPDPQAPLHVYATRDAIYVTCAGASLLGKHAANLALEGVEQQVSEGEDGGDDGAGSKTIMPGGAEENVIRVLRRGTMTILDRRAARREAGRPISNLLNNPQEMEWLRARLAHLARLIVRDRKPLCPINGVLVLVPMGGTDNDQEAQQTAELCARDLATLRATLRLQFTILVLCCDLETLPGFREFIQLVPARERLGRLGQGFPRASPGLAGTELQDHIHKSVTYICNNYLRDWVYRLFRVDTAEGQAAVAANTGLFLFLNEIRDRKNKLSRILTHGIAKDATFPLLYSGCYLAGTGASGENDQAFVAGVFKEKLQQNESKVAWSEEAFADDQRSRSWAKILSASLVAEILLIALAGFGVYKVLKP